MPSTTPLRVVIADDHEYFRIGFKNIFSNFYANDLNFVGEAANGKDLVNLVNQEKPDVVLTDIQMPFMNGIEACRIIKDKNPQIAVIAFSMFTELDKVMSMVQAGADGYLVKTSAKEEVINAIKSVSEHTPYYCSTISEKLFGAPVNSQQTRKNNPHLSFSLQEKKVMKLICNQLSTKEIANNMNLATRTVDHYRENILAKIGARNVVGIALFSVINEIVKLSDLCEPLL